MQYRRFSWLSDVNNVVSDFIQTNYCDFLKEYINAMSLQDETELIECLFQHYYGLPFIAAGSSTAENKYDSGKLYDNNVKYDEGLKTSTSIPYFYLAKFLKFILNYGEPHFNIDMIVSFFAEFLQLDKKDLAITTENKYTIVILIPATTDAIILTEMINAMGGVLMDFPFGNIIKIAYKDQYNAGNI